METLIITILATTFIFAVLWWNKRKECKELKLTANNYKFDFDRLMENKLYISICYDFCGAFKQYEIHSVKDWREICKYYHQQFYPFDILDSTKFLPVTKDNVIYKN